VRVWRGLWETTYGRLLLAKLALVLPLLALGAYNNRFAVPRLKAGIASAVERTRFLRTAGAELAPMAAIVGVTAVLVAQPPARAGRNCHLGGWRDRAGEFDEFGMSAKVPNAPGRTLAFPTL
jgi:hypothetical protein